MILLVNDDGIEAPGLRALYAALRARTGQPVLAVVPTQQRSGQSHALTLDRGLTVTPRLEREFFAFAVDGTPVDCVKVGLTVLCPEPPRLVVSGVNDGPNVGRSIFYSGTVGAAMEAAIEGFAALAASRDLPDDRPVGDWEDVAARTADIAAELCERSEFRGAVANLNLPATPAPGWLPLRVVPHGRSGFAEGYRPVRDAKDRVTWHLHGTWAAAPGEGESDAHLLRTGHPVLSLLEPDVNGDVRRLQRVFAPRPAARAPGDG